MAVNLISQDKQVKLIDDAAVRRLSINTKRSEFQAADPNGPDGEHSCTFAHSSDEVMLPF